MKGSIAILCGLLIAAAPASTALAKKGGGGGGHKGHHHHHFVGGGGGATAGTPGPTYGPPDTGLGKIDFKQYENSRFFRPPSIFDNR